MCYKKANYLLGGTVGAGITVHLVMSAPSVLSSVQFEQIVVVPPPAVVTFVQLCPGGNPPPTWRLTLMADTTRGARREMESLKNNISVKAGKMIVVF
jgi:hypothetical protein